MYVCSQMGNESQLDAIQSTLNKLTSIHMMIYDNKCLISRYRMKSVWWIEIRAVFSSSSFLISNELLLFLLIAVANGGKSSCRHKFHKINWQNSDYSYEMKTLNATVNCDKCAREKHLVSKIGQKQNTGALKEHWATDNFAAAGRLVRLISFPMRILCFVFDATVVNPTIDLDEFAYSVEKRAWIPS